MRINLSEEMEEEEGCCEEEQRRAGQRFKSNDLKNKKEIFEKRGKMEDGFLRSDDGRSGFVKRVSVVLVLDRLVRVRF